ncbi:CPBP family intramembrane glutamic endopeptidase [Pseudolysinimonas sp.]|uniref:CPBP family intramembrane glutamic endopeptidase n=1 Tax=Pseudolysinimonas sp. TaxID=2680009 RepID=UPI003F7D7CCF
MTPTALSSPDNLDGAPGSSARARWQMVLVLGLGLGQSAVYAVVQLIDYATRPRGLAGQTTTLNPSLSDRQYVDLTYQLLDIVFSLAPVVLAAYFVWSARRPHLGRLGLVRPRAADAAWGLGLAIVIGAGGIGVYLGARALGFAVGVDAAGLQPYWWTVPVLLLSALRAALQEEPVVLGFLYDRLGGLGWNRWAIIATAALVRGSYHLYQGWGGFVGNVVMGLIFGWLYTRIRRLLPFVVAHFVIDAAVFVGYGWAASAFPALFGVAGH